MSDRYPVSITIGGELLAKDVEEFLRVLRESGATFGWEWEGGIDDKIKTAEDLLAQRTGEYLLLTDNQCPGGEFYDLKPWLAAHNLSYNEHHEAYDSYSASFTKYRPGHPTLYTLTNDTREDMVLAEKVLKTREALDKGNIFAALKFCDEALGRLYGFPPLPKFSVVAYPSGKKSHATRRKKGPHRRR